MRIICGKKALVTGAAAGIGRAIALELAKEGADLFLIDISQENLEAVAREARGHGVEVITVVCDLSESAQISAAVECLRSKWGVLNILVNNAGIAYYGHTHSMTSEQWHRIMSVNLLAPIQLVRELLPILFLAKEAHILNVCALLGLVPWRKLAAYQTTKFGLVGFTAALRAEYYRDNFGVTALCPGFVGTSMLTQFEIPEGASRRHVPSWICTTSENTALKAVRAIRKNQGLVIITPTAHLYWRLTRLFPALVDWLTREGWRRRRPIA